jgi:hypothetical protein
MTFDAPAAYHIAMVRGQRSIDSYISSSVRTLQGPAAIGFIALTDEEAGVPREIGD